MSDVLMESANNLHTKRGQLHINTWDFHLFMRSCPPLLVNVAVTLEFHQFASLNTGYAFEVHHALSTAC